jgi:hypothetical protein
VNAGGVNRLHNLRLSKDTCAIRRYESQSDIYKSDRAILSS